MTSEKKKSPRHDRSAQSGSIISTLFRKSKNRRGRFEPPRRQRADVLDLRNLGGLRALQVRKRQAAEGAGRRRTASLEARDSFQTRVADPRVIERLVEIDALLRGRRLLQQRRGRGVTV